MPPAKKEMPRLMRQQNPQQGQRKRPPAAEQREMLPNPKKGKKIALARQGLLTQQKILHQQSPGTRSGKNTHREKAERQPGERASPGDRLFPQIYFCQWRKL
jgi:hypothetical protein